MPKGKYLRTKEHRELLSSIRKGRKQPPFTDEHKRKIGEALKGNKHFLGRRHTEEVKKRMSELKKGVPRKAETVEKMKKTSRERHPNRYTSEHPMLGKRHTEAARKKISLARAGKKLSIEQRERLKGRNKGEKHWNWKGGKSTEMEKIRSSFEYRLWRESVFKRDGFTCRFCGQKGGRLNADHIKPFALFPELRFAIDNGRTLCEPCHRTTDTYAGRCIRKNKAV